MKKVYVRATFTNGKSEVTLMHTNDESTIIERVKEVMDDVADAVICTEQDYTSFKLACTLNYKMSLYSERFDHGNNGQVITEVSLSISKN